MIFAQIYEDFKCNYLIKTKTKQNYLQQRFKISKYKCLPVSHFLSILLFSGRRCRIQMTSHSFTRWREQEIEKHKSNRFKMAVDGYRNSLSTLYLYWTLWKFDTRDRLTPGLVNHHNFIILIAEFSFGDVFDQQAKLPAVLWPYFTKTAIKRLSKCELFKAKVARFEAVRTKKLHWSFKWPNKPQSRAVLKEYIFLIKLKLTKLQTNRIILIIV